MGGGGTERASAMTLKGIRSGLAALALLSFGQAPAFASQTPADRADPSVVEDELRPEELLERPSRERPVVRSEARSEVAVSSSVVVGAIRIEGAEALPPAAFAAVISAYAGRLLSPSDMRALASDVANVARGAGYGLATAWIPPQRVSNGVLRVVIDEGRIDAIEADGSADGVARRLLAPLLHGRPVRTAELERRLLLAGDVAGVWIGKARLERRDGRNILHVKTQRERVSGRAYLDNWGSSTVGPVNLLLVADINGVAADDDRLTISGVLTPLQPREFHLVRAGYQKGLGTNGTMIGLQAYVAHSRPGGVLSDRDIVGDSVEGSLGVSHPLLRSRAVSVWTGIEFTVRDSHQTLRDITLREDRLATLTASLLASARAGDGYLHGRVALVQGTGAFDATRAGDLRASRADGSAIFTKLEARARYVRPLGGRFSLQLEGEGQIASRPLLSSEEMGLGGRNFLRSYDYREASGDKGVAASAEIRFDLAKLPRPVKAAQLYGYADAGSVGNYRDGRGGATLASAGGGARLSLGKFQAGLEIGFPLGDSPFSRGSRDPRVSFTLGARF